MPRRRPSRRRFGHRFGHLEQLETRRVMAVDVVAPLADVTVPAGAPAAIIDLATAFDLANVTGTVVRFSNNVGGNIFAELFDVAGPGRTRTTPATVANFLAYANAGRYTNTIVHRTVANFVVQAGGFSVPQSGLNLSEPITQFPTVVNEPGNTNTRGTLAMAKIGGSPNSATNQFFFNLANNSATLDAQNGGFTAFARVLGSGMAVVDAIAAVPRFNLGSPFNELPATGVTNATQITRDNLVTITSVTRVGELVYTASSSAPSLATATVGADGRLNVQYAASTGGFATITVRAASVFDPADFREDTFVVNVIAPGSNPNPTPVGQQSIIVTGSEIGSTSQPWVTVIDPTSGVIRSRFLAYEPSFRGGVRVAVGDVIPGGTPEIITASGPGRAGEIRVFLQDGTELPAYRTLPFSARYRGGLEVAVGEVNGDNAIDIVAAASRGPGLVNVYFVSPDAADPVPATPSRSFQAFPSSYLGGATVATADIGTFAGGVATNANAADGKMEVVVASGVGLSPLIRAYDLSVGASVVRTITPFSPSFRGGLSVSAGRFDNNSIDDIVVTGGYGSGSRIEVYSGRPAPNTTGLLATQQAFAALGRRNLPVYAAAIAAPDTGRIQAFSVVQGEGSGLGVRRIGVPLTAETTLTSLSGPLRIAASRPG